MKAARGGALAGDPPGALPRSKRDRAPDANTSVTTELSHDDDPVPQEISARRLRRSLLQLGLLAAVVLGAISLAPGLASLRHRLGHAAAGWLVVAALLELLSALSYVVIFRGVFCRRMSWRTSYRIGMSEQAANALLPASGVGGLALGAWALRQGGLSAEHIGRRSVAFFFLTSLANVGTVIVFALLFALGILGHDENPALTYGFGAASVVVTALVLALPALVKPRATAAAPSRGRLRTAAYVLRDSLGHGIRDAVVLVRQRSTSVLGGSLGTMAFDLATLGACFRAFGAKPAIGVLVLGYLIGQLGGNVPIPGGLDGGLIGTFALYHAPLASTTAAVLTYRAISLWLPALLGSVTFVQLRRMLRSTLAPPVICPPPPERVDAVALAVRPSGV
jgi:uncharacterized membrane protein YbhN (UPF0104 family)